MRKFKLEVEEKIAALQQENKKKEDMIAALFAALAKVQSKLAALEEATKKADDK